MSVDENVDVSVDVDENFEHLLEFLRTERGFDFTGYKRASLRRRVSKRMGDVGITGFGEYLDHLQAHPDEFDALFNTILINVTSFFRDADHWEHLEREIIPRIVANAGDRPIRVWSAGCSSGEEAYSLAMVFAEALGDERFVQQVKIYATDVDEEALTQARRARYSTGAMEGVPEERRAKFFVQEGDEYAFRSDLRSAVIFGRHDLLTDAPISRLDLLVCRNALMYFNSQTQGRILRHLHFALTPHGVLFLGKAEMLLTRTKEFEPIDLQHRMFRKLTETPERGEERLMARQSSTATPGPRNVRLRDAAFHVTPVAHLVIDLDGILTLANERVQQLFGLKPNDLGRPFADLEVSSRPVELLSRIEQAHRTGQPVHVSGVDFAEPGGDEVVLDVWLTQLADPRGAVIGTGITFQDVTTYEQLRLDLQHSTEELETAYEELQSTNEELETTNEELQSTVEELETTNEELQSSNEELETMNEELQSANAEQDEFNRALAVKSEQLDETNAFHAAVMSSLPAALVVVGTDFGIRTWNRGAFDLWGLREEEVLERSLLNLDIGLPVAELAPTIRTVLMVGEPTVVDLAVVTRLGRASRCRVALSPLADADGQAVGVTLLMTTRPSSRGPDQEDTHGDE